MKLDAPLRILHAADLHYDLHKFDWVVDVAGEVDLVILAGDHLEIANQIQRPAQAVVIRKYFQRINNRTRLIVCSGNHDLDERDEFGELISKWVANARLFGIPTDGDSPVIGDTLFSICPWRDGKNAEYDIRQQLERDAQQGADRWVWIHHAPPEGSPTGWDGRMCYGDEELRRWIKHYQPDLVFSGHVHQSPYIKDGSWVDRIGKTWVFNGGHQPGRVPSHVLIDTDLQKAFWKSAYGASTVSLDMAFDHPAPPMTDPPEWVRIMDRWAIPNQA